MLISCNEIKQNEVVHLEGYALGTTFSIKYIDDNNVKYDKAVDSLIQAINKSLSTYLVTSDISKINKGDSLLVVDNYFVDVFKKSKNIFNETNREFDPTIGILVNAWGFGPGESIPDLDSVKVKELLKFVGFEKVQLSTKNQVIKKYPEIYLDFNAIAKGYTVDVVGRFLESRNIDNYMVEIGGEIRARGKNHENNFWKIAIENPNTDGTRSFATYISLNNESIATSGNYRKFKIDENGQKYAHTISTKTGFSSKTDLLSVSVISTRDCADVDAYATAFMSMGYAKTIEFLKERTDLKVVLIYSKPDGSIETYATVKLEN